MGGAPSLKPFNVKLFPFFPIILTITTFILIASAEDHDSKENEGIPSLEDDNDVATSSPPPSSSGDITKKSVTFKPNTKVIIGVLFATFSLTILILLYIKHCSSGDTFVANPREAHLHRRKNSGIERDVVESLPVFRFGSLRGQKHGLECAVCLNGFEDPEVLRLLPKCKHAFHVECVDMWLDEHSTCPLCRYKVNINDVVQVGDQNQNVEEEEEEEPSLTEDIESRRGNNNNDNHNNDNVLQPGNLGFSENDNVLQPRSVGSSSRRVSCVGERESELLEIVLQQEDSTGTSSFRRSLNSSDRKSGEHKLEHRIIISHSRGVCERWSDCQPSDLLYLTSDMIIKNGSSLQHSNNSSGCLGGRRAVVEGNRRETVNGGGGGRRGGGKWRSVSAMTGMRRILSREKWRERERRGGGGGGEEQQQRREGMVSRWLTWTSKSQSEREVC